MNVRERGRGGRDGGGGEREYACIRANNTTSFENSFKYKSQQIQVLNFLEKNGSLNCIQQR